MKEIFKQFKEIGIIPVVVMEDAQYAEKLADVLCDNGLPCAEVTFRTAAAAEVISRMVKHRPELLVGAGTVLTTQEVDLAIAAGAKFIVSPGPNLDDYVLPGVAADLTDYLADGWLDTFVGGEAAFAQQTYDGKIYAVPLNIAAACVFYNKEMFEEAGCEIPTTFDELLDCCQKLQDAGFTPITISAGTAWCLSMLAGYLCDREGVDLDALAAGDESWVNDKTLAAGEKLLELSQYFQETAASDSNDIATANFYDEEAAILLQGSWVIGQMNGANEEIEDKCGVFSFPVSEDPSRTGVIAKSDSLAMSATTEHPEAAIALMKYFTDDTAQKYTAEKGGKIPVTNVEYDADAAPAQLADVMNVFSNASSTFGFYNESLISTEAGSTFDDNMVALFLGKETPEEAFQAVEDFYAANRG